MAFLQSNFGTSYVQDTFRTRLKFSGAANSFIEKVVCRNYGGMTSGTCYDEGNSNEICINLGPNLNAISGETGMYSTPS